MEELFRFIQQAFVAPGDAQQIDLATDSDFQNHLRDLIKDGRPYSEVRTAAAKLLDDIFGSSGTKEHHTDQGNNDARDFGDDYGDSLERVNKYRVLRETLLALLAASAITAEKVDQAVKDVFGKFASELVKSAEFLADKTFASDILVAVKLVTRFDNVYVPAITVMRQVIAFVEDLAAGRVPAEWHPIQLAPPSSAVTDSTSPAPAAEYVRTLLQRPLQIPAIFLPHGHQRRALLVPLPPMRGRPRHARSFSASMRHCTGLTRR
jgi:hypothetical protein